MLSQVDLMLKYKLTPSMAQVMVLLMENRIVTPTMVEVDQPITTDGKVLMHRLRRRLTGTQIEVKSQRSVGYWLDQTSREIVKRDLADDQLNLPSDHGAKNEAAPSLVA